MFILSEKVYNVVKHLVQVILPACATAYFALAGIYGWDNAEQVVGTIAVITTFLGVCLGISTKAYNSSDKPFDGDVVITQPVAGGNKVFDLQLNGDPNDLVDKDRVTFKVVRDLAA